MWSWWGSWIRRVCATLWPKHFGCATRSTNSLNPSSSWSFKRSSKLRTLQAHWKNITTSWSISSNNISSSLEEESWLELENNILFTWVKMERDKYFGVLKQWWKEKLWCARVKMRKRFWWSKMKLKRKCLVWTFSLSYVVLMNHKNQTLKPPNLNLNPEPYKDQRKTLKTKPSNFKSQKLT